MRRSVSVWLWTDDPTGIAKSGTLQIEEPITVSEEYFIHLGDMGSPYQRSNEAELLKYDVLIHIDQVQDFSTSPTNGLPSVELEEEWPVCYRHYWVLGVRDGEIAEPRRRSVHDRLGGRRRDDSPPGDGQGGARRTQFPPPSLHDRHADGRFAGPSRSGTGNFGAGSQGRHGYRRGGVDAVEEDVQRKTKSGVCTVEGDATGQPVSCAVPKQFGLSEDLSWAGCQFLVGETQFKSACSPMVDPMQEEADLQLASGGSSGPGWMGDEVQMHDVAGGGTDHGVGQQTDAGAEMLSSLPGSGAGVISTVPAGQWIPEGPVVSPGVVGSGVVAGPCSVVPGQAVGGPPLGPQEPAGLTTDCGSAMALGDVQAAGTSVLDTRLLHFFVPIKRPVLQTPVAKLRATSAKLRATSAAKKRMDTLIPQKEILGSTTRSERRSSRLANKPRSNLSVEEQATALLIKKCGLAENITTPTAADQNKLHTQFVGPLEANVVGGMRDMFGLSEEGAPDKLGALLIDAEA